MPFIEAPTTFYLGRQFNPATKSETNNVVYYDSRHLTTHAIVVGMTGSGKTGLCINLLEEAALDNIPAIVIDPKGDITNLALNFPNLQPGDFEPWVNVDDARRANMDIPQFAAKTARTWRDELNNWSIAPERLLWLKHAAQVSVYTPGSEAGLPVSILASLKAPKEGWAGNEEEYREEISGIVTALLGLIGRSSAPVQDKEHVLISNIFEYAWSRGNDLSLQDIVKQVQEPPFQQLGVFPLDDYLSAKQRSKLATDLNNILAAPSFQAWLSGEPLDVQKLLYQSDGRPRVSILYLAHLSEAERQFVMTLLLENVISWMRTLSGTTSLRALLYIDEMYGYFPPYPFNPPTKAPLLRLLKQARAFGLGLMLATQNPGDLDYKGLSNTGTWFIGRLNTDNDKQRLMAGLQSMSNTNDEINLKALDSLISDLEPRTFILSDVHDPNSPYIFKTRQTMSYLRGPLTKQHIQKLMQDQRAALLQRTGAQPPQPPPPTYLSNSQLAANYAAQAAYFRQQSASAPPPTLPEAPPTLPEAEPAPSPMSIAPVQQRVPAQVQRPSAITPAQTASSGLVAERPTLNQDVPQYFIPPVLAAAQALAAWQQRTGFAMSALSGVALAYRPVLLGQTAVRFQDRKSGTFTVRLFTYQIPSLERIGLIHWGDYVTPPLDTRTIAADPLPQSLFGEVPPGIAEPKRLVALRREMVDMLYATARLNIPFNSALGLYGSPDSDLNEFRAVVQQAARERRDADADAVSKRYEDLLDNLSDKMQRYQTTYQTAQGELQTNKRLKTFTTGEAILGLMKGQTSYTLSRMNMAEYWKQRTQGKLDMSQLQMQQINEEIEELQRKFNGDMAAVNEKWARVAVTVEEHSVQPYKKDILVELFGIGWQPHWYAESAGQPVLLPAF